MKKVVAIGQNSAVAETLKQLSKNMYLGFKKDGEITFVTDGNCCYGDDGKAYCGECYHYGSNYVNCGNAGLSEKDGLVPVKWDGEKWVLSSTSEL